MTSPMLQCEPRRVPGASAAGTGAQRDLAFDRRADSYSAAATVQRHLVNWLGE